jgi:hypothetical protein
MFRFSFALRRKRTAVTPLPSRLRRATFPNREGFLSSVNYNLSSHRLAYAFRSKQQAYFSIFPIDKPPSLGYTYFNT